MLGGFGYAALITLLAARLRARDSRIIDAVAATGQRSLTSYLAQSVVWTLAFTPFLLDLADTLTVAGTALLATATWLVTVILADRMRRASYRGPFELLLRRFTYRRPRRRRTRPRYARGSPTQGLYQTRRRVVRKSGRVVIGNG